VCLPSGRPGGIFPDTFFSKAFLAIRNRELISVFSFPNMFHLDLTFYMYAPRGGRIVTVLSFKNKFSLCERVGCTILRHMRKEMSSRVETGARGNRMSNRTKPSRGKNGRAT